MRKNIIESVLIRSVTNLHYGQKQESEWNLNCQRGLRLKCWCANNPCYYLFLLLKHITYHIGHAAVKRVTQVCDKILIVASVKET